MVDYSAFCALNGVQLEKLKIVTEDDIDLRGFLRLDPEVSSGYDDLRYTVRIKGDGGLLVRGWGGIGVAELRPSLETHVCPRRQTGSLGTWRVWLAPGFSVGFRSPRPDQL